MTGVLKAKVGANWVAVGSPIEAQRIHWNSAWGVIVKVEGPGIVNLSTTNATLFSTSATLASGRRYSISISARAVDSTAASALIVELLVDGAPISGPADHYLPTQATGVYGAGHETRWILDGDGATRTYTVRGKLVAGTGGFHAQSGASAFLVVEDIGPVTRIPEGTAPPTDWTAYDSRYVNADGDAVTGTLHLPAVQSTAPTAATNRAYVDFLANDVVPAVARWISVGGASSTTPTSVGWGYFLPLICPPCTIDGLGCEVTTAGAAGSVVRLGIYANHATRLEPSTLLRDAGTVVSTSTGWKSLAITPTVHPGGWLWFALASQVAGCDVRAVSGHGEPWVLFGTGPQVPPGLPYRAWTSPSFNGAFPATITDIGVANQLNPKVAFKTSA